jgi:hypothetical protein
MLLTVLFPNKQHRAPDPKRTGYAAELHIGIAARARDL